MAKRRLSFEKQLLILTEASEHLAKAQAALRPLRWSTAYHHVHTALLETNKWLRNVRLPVVVMKAAQDDATLSPDEQALLERWKKQRGLK
jgi:hypothetical protein